MAESTLSVTYSDLQRTAGHFAGWGNTTTDYSPEQKLDIDEHVIKRCLRQVYYPQLVPGFGPYEWKFLKPIGTIAMVVGQQSYELPADYGGMDGPFTYPEEDGGGDIKVVGESEIRSMYQSMAPAGVAKVAFAAIRPQAPSEQQGTTVVNGSAVAAGTGQRFNVIFWPEPTVVVVLTYRYHALTDMIDADANPYPLGGMPMAETFIASCLSICEQHFNDKAGAHTDTFRRRLAAAIAFDKNAHTPEHFGYMGDNSDAKHLGRNRRGYVRHTGLITYNGVLP